MCKWDADRGCRSPRLRLLAKYSAQLGLHEVARRPHLLIVAAFMDAVAYPQQSLRDVQCLK